MCSYHFGAKLDLGSFDSFEDVLWSECLKLTTKIKTASSAFDDRDVGNCKSGMPTLIRPE